jgi:hypothetical protein
LTIPLRIRLFRARARWDEEFLILGRERHVTVHVPEIRYVSDIKIETKIVKVIVQITTSLF